jgi:hypothetical protein
LSSRAAPLDGDKKNESRATRKGFGIYLLFLRLLRFSLQRGDARPLTKKRQWTYKLFPAAYLQISHFVTRFFA